jgi:fido (protein-threonine AMPylation protein)
MGRRLREHFGSRLPLPRNAIPKWLFKAVAPAFGVSRRYVEGNVDHPFVVDNGKSQRELGVTYRPLKKSLVDMVTQMLESARTDAS